MASKEIWTFFYGSYMNFKVLMEVGIVPKQYETAKLTGFAIRIQPRANLIPSEEHCVYGILATATHEELKTLYTHAHDVLGETYLPEAVQVETLDGKWKPALCYIASHMEQKTAERAYVKRIVNPAKEFRFPEWYIKRLQKFYP